MPVTALGQEHTGSAEQRNGDGVAEDIVSSSSGVLVRRLTLYKHGVAFVERQGQIRGEALSLNFRANEINDALKSLLAIDHGGGQVLGIHYDTPADRQARLAAGP